MTIRILRSLLCIVCLSSTGIGLAQSPYGGMGQSKQGYAPAGYYNYQPHPSSASAAGYEKPLPGSRAAMVNEMFMPDSQVYPTDFGHRERALDRYFRKAFDRSWFRLEALHWDIDDPMTVTLGADPIIDETGALVDPTEERVIFDDTPTAIGTGFTPVLPSFSFNDNNGIRGTFGREDEWGSFQLSFWGVEEASESSNFNDLLVTPDFYLTTTLKINGAPSNAALLTDEYFGVSHETSLWGANSEWRIDVGQWPDGMNVQFITGANFTQMHDVMNIETGFSNQGMDLLLASGLESDVMNNLYGTVVGLNLDFEAPLGVTFGLTPRAILSLNNIRYKTSTRDLAFVGDTRTVEEDIWEFAPILSIAAYAKVKLNDSFSMYVSWEGNWLSRVGKAGNSVNYNDNLATPRTDIGPQEDLDSLTTSGITVGGELLLY